MGQMDLRDHIQEGWMFHDFPWGYTCGHCGVHVSTSLGLNCEAVGHPCVDGRVIDVRLCTNCLRATTFCRNGLEVQEQKPAPLLGQVFDAPDDEEDSAIKLVIDLYDDARRAMSVDAASCAVLMFRKLLMHIAVEKRAKKGEGFGFYCDYLKSENVVAAPQYKMLTRIQKAGNAENHQVRRATEKDAEDLLELMAHLIKGIYFMD